MSNLLNDLLLNWQSSKHIVAVSDTEHFTAADFLDACSRLIIALRESEEDEFVLSCKNSYYFAIAVFALLHEDKKICLPPGIEKGHIESLKNQRGIISDFYPDALHPLQTKKTEPIQLGTIPKGNISLFTSGSTGESKEINKTLDHFSSEINVLEETWELSKSSVAIASVSHQHIYGLLFKILWSMAYKRPFYISSCLYEDQLNRVVEKFPDSHLISCPAHLDAMVKFPSIGIIKNKIIFSSGAPLSFETSNNILSAASTTPIEVFGSTETGGIAWRKQTKSKQWQTLNTVKIKNDKSQTLWVKSAFSEIQNEWYETSDKAEIISEKCFNHLGRKDRIAKVSGKRLSLDEMENRLKVSEYICDCKIIILEENGLSKRTSTAVIAILSQEGKRKLEDLGRRKFSTLLKTDLKDYYTPVLIPRFWRYINEFPINSQGKIQTSLLKLFFEGFEEKEHRFPDLKSLNCSNDSAKLKFTVPVNCSFFDGHFNGSPILPGVAQIFWVQFYTEKLLGLSCIKGINRLKFQRIIQPGDDCSLELIAKNGSVNFQYLVQDEICSSGSVKYE